MKRLLEPDEPIRPGDEMWNAMKGKFEPVFSKLDKACNGAVIVREVSDLGWREAKDNTLDCWVMDGKHVLQDVADVKLIGEPHEKQIRATHWMPKIEGMPEPKLPEKSAEELAYEKFISERYHVHTLSPGEAKTAGAAWCAAIEFMKEQMGKK